jgi:hypothetical protein
MHDGQDPALENYLADKDASRMSMPWKEIVSKNNLSSDEELFCVATWGRASLLYFPQFWRSTMRVKADLDAVPDNKLVGYSLSISLRPLNLGFQAETVTVWRSREDMAAFFRGEAHQYAAEETKHFLRVFIKRVWVTIDSLPVNNASAVAFWSAVKSGKYRDV